MTLVSPAGDGFGTKRLEDRPLRRLSWVKKMQTLLQTDPESQLRLSPAFLNPPIEGLRGGKEYGTESIQWLLNWAFRWGKLRKVGLMVCDYNVGGTKLYEKLGFKLEGRLRGEMRYDGEGGMIWSTERWRENGRIAMGMLKWKWRSLDRDANHGVELKEPFINIDDFSTRLSSATSSLHRFRLPDNLVLEYKTALRKGSYEDLNLYFLSDIPGGNLGSCTYPQQNITDLARRRDGCSNLAGTLPGAETTDFDLGKTAVHETGH
ncbi:uncharacterized protein MYCGRDRAFT_95640 [Zymoseptoria tritici IPO323]|uniref:N-acetyltransferase domain-containing protein n=1 Tax=Zymoseptoria tritici (strain CBS 115943 / IPO323) TaxID=336722 RepID=F9XJH7_ZYMTI|nr:uncharacterized protein MYCGRDRAFT_95640 [Zymoseptoria tritici IPO323]EGP84325.1 hypothetical protein MYCGRDRAFT_95640 [Zymoseptoria tritici IPO323]